MKLEISRAVSAEDKAECYRLRHIVFVEEQGVPVELEIDEYDETIARHFIGKVNGQAVAASRICVFDDTAKIQRVVVLEARRGRGYGRDLTIHMLKDIRADNLAPSIALDAQTHAVPFYEALGFAVEGNEFDDAGIPHLRMIQPA